MAEIWGAAIAAGGAILGGISAEKKAKADRKAANQDRQSATKESVVFDALSSQFEKEQDYYYNQLERQNKSRGLDEYRKFSTVNSFAPQYENTSGGIIVPDKPSVEALANQAITLNQQLNPTQAKKKKSNGLLKVIAATSDPVLGKLTGIL